VWGYLIDICVPAKTESVLLLFTERDRTCCNACLGSFNMLALPSATTIDGDVLAVTRALEIQFGSHVHMLFMSKNYISEYQKIQTKNFTCTSS
jgi:hypothetical protein